MMLLGIDPGVHGGIGFITDDYKDESFVATGWSIPPSLPELRRLLMWLVSEPRKGFTPFESFAMIERVRSSPQMGVVSSFTFGRCFGQIESMLVALQIPHEEVQPKQWQREMGVIYPKGSTQTQRKNISKARAQALFPEQKVTHAIADAMLIAEYCRRTRK